MDHLETAKAIVGGAWELFEEAENKLDAAVESGDQTAAQFWRSMFRELSRLMEKDSTLDDVTWHTYRAACRYADGALPSAGPERKAEKDGPDKAKPC
jgi:hypothetical protein